MPITNNIKRVQNDLQVYLVAIVAYHPIKIITALKVHLIKKNSNALSYF